MRGLLAIVFLGACVVENGIPKGGDDTVDTGDTTERPVDTDRDGSPLGEDCDDTDPAVYPGADETCNGVDDDCDRAADDDDPDLVADTWYIDIDGDGYGDDDSALVACDAPDRGVAYGGDCDDSDPAYHPSADESDCTDPNDYNCDGEAGYGDSDDDGYAACEECDDRDAERHPEARETCDDTDDDCDGLIDDDDPSVTGTTTWYEDADEDGYGDQGEVTDACDQPEGTSAVAGDCDDHDDDYNPGATEYDCTDPNDYDCDGEVAYADDDEDGRAACVDCDDDDEDVQDERTWHADGDDDGYGSAYDTETDCHAPDGYVSDDSDCDDHDASVHPDATETCNGVDDDCDHLADDEDTGVTGTTSWYEDEDGDGYGSSTSVKACDAPEDHVADPGDCDDGDGAVHPDASEVCNDVDDDCDDLVDDEDTGVTGTSTWYRDSDGDGHGSASATTEACDQPGGYTSQVGDCKDYDGTVNPDAEESCNDVDDDCDDLVDEDDPDLVELDTWYLDADDDGYGDESATTEACDAPDGYTGTPGDCDDAVSSVNPGKTDRCNAVDDDCSGVVDDGGECPCDVAYADDGHPYLFCTDAASWSDARKSCEKLDYTLVSIADAEEDAWVNASAVEVSASSDWWIGYSDATTEGTWLWEDGSTSTYTGWGTSQPDGSDAQDEDCAAWLPYTGSGWQDTGCDNTLGYVCEAG